jgi:hypothetical protein
MIPPPKIDGTLLHFHCREAEKEEEKKKREKEVVGSEPAKSRESARKEVSQVSPNDYFSGFDSLRQLFFKGLVRTSTRNEEYVEAEGDP